MNIYLDSFVTFSKIGVFTLGGGYAMLPLIEEEVVLKRKWIDSKDFLDLVAIAQSSPGVFAVNISIFIGYRLRGVRGALTTTLGCVLPSFFIILFIALFFHQFKENTVVERIFKGIRPAVVALIAAPTFKMARDCKINWYNIWIPIVCALLVWLIGVSPVYIIIAAGTLGYLYGRFYQEETQEEEHEEPVLSAEEAQRIAREKEKQVRILEAEIKKAKQLQEEATRKEAEAREQIANAREHALRAKEEAKKRIEEEKKRQSEEPDLLDLFDPRKMKEDDEDKPLKS